MADRYWVGGTANWDATAGTKWALTSGGVGGQAVPTAADDVYFDAGSGAVTVTVNAFSVCRNLSFTSGAGNFTGTFAGSQPITISGNLTLSTGNTISYTGTLVFNSTTSQTITSNGVVIGSSLTFNGVGGSWLIADNLVSGISRTLTLTNGTVEIAANRKITIGLFASDNSNVRSLIFQSGSFIELTAIANAGNVAVWFANTITNLTVTGAPDVRLTGNSTANNRTINNGTTAGATEARAISFTVSAGSDTILFGANNAIKNLIFTSFTGTLNNNTRTIYGDLTLSPGMTATGFNLQTFAATSGTQTITSNGVSFDFSITVNAPGATVVLADNFTTSLSRALTLTNGTLIANGNVSIGAFALGAGTKTLTLGSGTWTILSSGFTIWNANTNSAGLTVSASTGTVSLTSASAKTFAGGGFTWPTLNQGGAGALTITGSNAFANITNTYGATGATTITFTAGTTQTVSRFTASGTVGKVLTLNSNSAGTRFNLSDPSGLVSVSYCDIKDSNVIGGARWLAYLANGNVNSGNNLGWRFSQGEGLNIISGLSGTRGLSIGVGLVGNL